MKSSLGLAAMLDSAGGFVLGPIVGYLAHRGR